MPLRPRTIVMAGGSALSFYFYAPAAYAVVAVRSGTFWVRPLLNRAAFDLPTETPAPATGQISEWAHLEEGEKEGFGVEAPLASDTDMAVYGLVVWCESAGELGVNAK